MSKAPEAFRTISEAAGELDLPQHVLRFWETRFAQVKPMKRAGGRRYYRRDDIDLLRGVRELLYERGYTIKGVQRVFKERGAKHVVAIGRGEAQGGEGTDEAVPAPDASGAEPIADALVGAPRIPGAAAGNPAITEDDRALLNEVLLDLLECKRILDQAR